MSAAPDWARPHPLTVVVLVGSFVADNAVPLVLVLVAGGGGIGFDTVAVLAGVGVVGWGALGWYMTGYAVSDEAVEYRSGVVRRQARSIPLDRIQQVSVAEPLLARIVGLAVVQVAEASADGDVEIRYLGLAQAHELTERLRGLARARGGEPSAAALTGDGSTLPPPPAPPATRVHATRIADLVKYQVASVAPVFGLMIVVTVVVAVVVGLASGAADAGIALLVGLAAVVFVPVTVAVSSTLQFGNFALVRGPRSLTMDTGLLSRRQVEVRPDRIQTLTVSSGPVARRLDLHEVRFSAATGKALKQQAMVHLAPAARTSEVPGLVQGSVDVDAGFGVDLEGVSVLTIRRALVRAALLYLLVGAPGCVALFVLHPVAPVVASAAWWAAAVWYARARHARLGLSLDGRRLVVRRGVLQHHLTQLPLVNVQSVSTSASFFQRRLGLADLRVSTAGIGPNNAVVVPDLAAPRADALRLRLAAAAAGSRWELRT